MELFGGHYSAGRRGAALPVRVSCLVLQGFWGRLFMLSLPPTHCRVSLIRLLIPVFTFGFCSKVLGDFSWVWKYGGCFHFPWGASCFPGKWGLFARADHILLSWSHSRLLAFLPKDDSLLSVAHLNLLIVRLY